MKRIRLLLPLAAVLSLAACAGTPTLSAAPEAASHDAIDINDPSRPMFGGTP